MVLPTYTTFPIESVSSFFLPVVSSSYNIPLTQGCFDSLSDIIYMMCPQALFCIMTNENLPDIHSSVTSRLLTKNLAKHPPQLSKMHSAFGNLSHVVTSHGLTRHWTGSFPGGQVPKERMCRNEDTI